MVDEEFSGITYLCRHLIRQPSAATFSHWRRLSFVSALSVNNMVATVLEMVALIIRIAQNRPFVSS